MWIKVILVAEMLFLFGRTRSDMRVHSSKACHAAKGCSMHILDECSHNQNIAIVDAYYTDNKECTTQMCPSNFISIPENTDRTRLETKQLSNVEESCNFKPRCSSPAQIGHSHQRYSVIKYLCIDDYININMCSGETKSGCDVLLLFSGQNNCPCLIRRKTIKGSDIQGMLDFYLLGLSLPNRICTNVDVHIGGEMRSYNCTAPLTAYHLLASGIQQTNNDTRINIENPRNNEPIWIQIRGSESFTVTCSSISTTPPGSKHSSLNDSETCHGYLTTPPPRQSTTNGIPGGTASNETADEVIGKVAGGVTVAVLVIVAMVLFFLWFKYKRNQNSKTKSSIGKSSSENCSETTRIPVHNYHEIEAMKPKQPMSNYDYAAVAGEVNHTGQEGQSPTEEGKPKEKGDHVTTMLTVKSYNNKSFTDNEDDYNHLASNEETKIIDNGVHSGGYDTAASASKSVQQIRNKEVSNVDSECDYNHIDNNPKPKPLQGDYDTTASASKAVAKMMETNEQTEDDYDHFQQSKADSQAADSPYDTAVHQTDDSGDYSIAGVLQKNDPYDLAK